jgi:signal peptidase I
VLVQRLGASAHASLGDVVVIRTPGAPEGHYLKRLIGGPGDVVLVSDGRAIPVPDGHYFALADNRLGSFDSHQGWFVAADDLVGRVVVSYWPPAAAGPVLPRSGPEAVAAHGVALAPATRS